MDVLVHGQDIAIPLGLDRRIATEPAVLAAQRLWGMGFPFHARKRFAGVRLVADDADFRVGSGDAVTGSMGDILLALAGRRDGLARLSGPGSGHRVPLSGRNSGRSVGVYDSDG